MSQIYAFHKTVRGHLHVMNEFPCEDSSASLSEKEGRYYIAVVADGHGSKSCFRSAYGSKVATEIATECLQKFAQATLASKEVEDRFYKDMFSNPRYQQMTIRQLTDTIVAGWHDCILEHYKNNPPSIEEMGESILEYENGKNPAHIYGTTLIAALQLPKCLILVQQGDGRCDVFYADGSVDQPIPWDSRCEDTATTSLCDEDVAESFRNTVINLDEKPLMACYLGCDGVEDAYRDTYEELGGSHVLMGGVHTFYKDLTCQLSLMGQEEFQKYLDTMLPEFSANGKFSRSGSGDDISVAGIVDPDIIKNFVVKYNYDIKYYALEEELFWKEDELRSKTRKHSILKKRMEEAQTELETARSEQQKLEEVLEQLKSKKKEADMEAVRKKAEMEGYNLESQSVFEKLKEKYFYLNNKIQYFLNEVSSGYTEKEADYSKIRNNLLEYEKNINRFERACNIERKKILVLGKKLMEAKSKFEEYDIKYQAIDTDRIRIENEIAALRGENSQGIISDAEL